MTSGERLMELRKSRGLSQESLGDMIDVTRQTVSKWERGDSTPELEKLIELARVFDVSLDELAGLERKAAEGGSEQADDAACTPWRWHYEYKSRRTLFGLPLVHINIGRGMFRARGILAIGTAATGAVAIGPCALGLIALGPVAVGLLSAGAMALGIAAAGAVAAGYAAAGCIAVGQYAVGTLAVGAHAYGLLTASHF